MKCEKVRQEKVDEQKLEAIEEHRDVPKKSHKCKAPRLDKIPNF